MYKDHQSERSRFHNQGGVMRIRLDTLEIMRLFTRDVLVLSQIDRSLEDMIKLILWLLSNRNIDIESELNTWSREILQLSALPYDDSDLSVLRKALHGLYLGLRDQYDKLGLYDQNGNAQVVFDSIIEDGIVVSVIPPQS